MPGFSHASEESGKVSVFSSWLTHRQQTGEEKGFSKETKGTVGGYWRMEQS